MTLSHSWTITEYKQVVATVKKTWFT